MLRKFTRLFFLCAAVCFSGWSFADAKETFEYRIDFDSPEVRAAVSRCPYARVQDGTLIVEIPKEKGLTASGMVRIPLDHLLDEFAGFFIETQGEVSFSGIPQPKLNYHGAKFQFHVPGCKSNEWPSALRLPVNQKPFGSQEWYTAQSQILCPKGVTGLTLELGLQQACGHFEIKNILLRKGRPGPVSIFSLKEIPRAKYTVQQIHRVRGVMSPSTKTGPREEDFAQIAEWGGNLIRWQMGLGTLKDAQQARALLWERFDQIEKVLEMASRHSLMVVLDVHTMGPSRSVILGTPEGRDVLVEFWCETARRFKGHPNLFGFNLMNEPVSAQIEPGGPTLNEQYHRLIKAIREIDPKTPIILDTDGSGVVDQIEFMEVFPYENVIYSPHFYKPFELTHQLNQHQKEYLAYPNPERGWDKEHLRELLEPARKFQEATGARIYIGEFSCIRWAPGADRFIEDCIDIFEEYGWDWSYHAFREWQGWDVECSGEPGKPVWVPDHRKEVLLRGLQRNRMRRGL